MITHIKKAVFPVAGLGTRFLPATKVNPKEMLPVVDKPLIQYAAEEAIRAGITELIFITGRTKNAITDHFDMAYELETELERRGKTEMLECVRSIVPSWVTCIFIRQPVALGLGHAIQMARPVVGEQPFAVLLADDLMDSPESGGCLAQMVDVYNACRSSVLAVEQVPREHISQYGVVRYAAGETPGKPGRIDGIVEKPAAHEAPSDYAVVGRYVLSARIFNHLERVRPGKGGEIQLTDAIAMLMEEEPVTAMPFTGKRFDCGSKLGYLQANVEHGLRHADTGGEFRAYLKQLAATL
jgi:UTP--glucose-1-phosphate uridylyltransferase